MFGLVAEAYLLYGPAPDTGDENLDNFIRRARLLAAIKRVNRDLVGGFKKGA